MRCFLVARGALAACTLVTCTAAVSAQPGEIDKEVGSWPDAADSSAAAAHSQRSDRAAVLSLHRQFGRPDGVHGQKRAPGDQPTTAAPDIKPFFAPSPRP